MTSGASVAFSYSEFTSRNAGFLFDGEQGRLRDARVFVCGAGGMGGAAIVALVRAGVGHIAIADPDRFELSNLNRQLFATLDTIGERKVDVVRRAVRDINPDIEVESFGDEWLAGVDAVLDRYPLVINAMDDVAAGVVLYRRARARGATIIDAYTSPLPSVTVVRPAAPRPEDRLGYPSVGLLPEAITSAIAAACVLREIEYVLVHSSSARYFDMAMAREFFAGRRRRPSFAPMVITTGNLMCFEAVKLLLRRGTPTDERGYFFDPWRAVVERPRGTLAAFAARRVVRHRLRELAS